MSHQLAIIIPAYKDDFLAEALESLANQTNKNFVVYIGDDCSPHDIESVVKEYTARLKIIYKRFDSNLGGTNLVAQWNRCLEMIKEEDWFIMFSDDDLMDDSCIEVLYKTISRTNYDVYRFDLKVIDKYSTVLYTPNQYPQILSSIAFYNMLFRGKIDAKMPEFVFRTAHFKRLGGFVPFDYAIRTDNATVMSMASDKSIYTIRDSFIHWRHSGINLSSPIKNKALVFGKLNAAVEFFDWATDFCESRGSKDPLSLFVREKELIFRFVSSLRVIGIRESCKVISKSKLLKRNKFRSLVYLPIIIIQKLVFFLRLDK